MVYYIPYTAYCILHTIWRESLVTNLNQILLIIITWWLNLSIDQTFPRQTLNLTTFPAIRYMAQHKDLNPIIAWNDPIHQSRTFKTHNISHYNRTLEGHSSQCMTKLPYSTGMAAITFKKVVGLQLLNKTAIVFLSYQPF